MQLKLTFNIRPVPHQSVRIGRNNIAYKPKKIIKEAYNFAMKKFDFKRNIDKFERLLYFARCKL